MAASAVKASERRVGVTVKDVAADLFIKEYASHLKKTGKLRLPKYADIIKTGVSRELSPMDADWFYIRVGTHSNYLHSILARRWHRAVT
jgi:small subunit ribosomal protein S19e